MTNFTSEACQCVNVKLISQNRGDAYAIRRFSLSYLAAQMMKHFNIKLLNHKYKLSASGI